MGMIRGVIQWSSKISSGVFLFMFCASASLAATNDLNMLSDTVAQTIHRTNESPIKTSVGINSECCTGYFTNFSSVIIAPESNDVPVGLMNECFEETATITLHKDGDKIIWSLAPSLGRFSLNPIDVIKNLQVQLQYRF
jgi:hypothetical protein